MTEQINHRARVGMQIERSGSVTTRRVLAVANGDEQFSTLTPTERTTAHALVDARISERTSKQRFGRDTRAAGSTTASLDDGNLIEARLEFCTETIFSDDSKVDLVTSVAGAGYDVVVHAVMIPSTLAAPRIAARVAGGGHDVPADKLRARYERLSPNVVSAVPYCYRSVFHDNATDDGPNEVASYRYGVADHPLRWPTWTPEPLQEL